MDSYLVIFLLLFLPTFVSGQCHTSLTDAAGNFSSTGYPESYNNNENCSWVINSTESGQILLNLVLLNIQSCEECNCDYIEVRDGPTISDRVIGKYCGEFEDAITILGSGNQLYILFVSDEEEPSNGFSATYTTEKNCSQTFNTQNGTLASPRYNGNYPNNANCIYEIIQTPGERIVLKVIDFILEEPTELGCNDYMEIREAADSPPVLSYCGEQDGFRLISTNNTFSITFVSDGNNANPGFTIGWEKEVCGGEFTDAMGLLASPQYLNMYPYNTDCIYMVRQPVDKKAWIKFDRFMLENPNIDGECLDFVEIRESSTSPVINTLCGEQEPFSLVSTDNTFWMRFKSNFADAAYGFKVYYEELDCEKMYTDRAGSVMAPTFANSYANNANCTFKFSRPAGDIIIVTFTLFMLEPPTANSSCFDYVEVENNQICDEQDPFQIFFDSNEGQFKFTSDMENSDMGFVAQYDVVNVTITETSGEVRSPGYPVVFPQNLTASYVLRKPFPEAILLNFTNFNFPERVNDSCTDFLLVREIMNGGKLANLTELCGTLTKPLIIISEANEIKLDLVTTHNDEFFDGFRMLFAPVIEESESTSPVSTTIRQTTQRPPTTTEVDEGDIIVAASALRPEIIAVIIIALAIVVAFAVTMGIKIRSNQTGKMEPRVHNSQEILSPYSQNNSTLTINNLTYQSTDDIDSFKFDE